MKPTDHFCGRVYEWPVSKEQFNHILRQLEHYEKELKYYRRSEEEKWDDWNAGR